MLTFHANAEDTYVSDAEKILRLFIFQLKKLIVITFLLGICLGRRMANSYKFRICSAHDDGVYRTGEVNGGALLWSGENIEGWISTERWWYIAEQYIILYQARPHSDVTIPCPYHLSLNSLYPFLHSCSSPIPIILNHTTSPSPLPAVLSLPSPVSTTYLHLLPTLHSQPNILSPKHRIPTILQTKRKVKPSP